MVFENASPLPAQYRQLVDLTGLAAAREAVALVYCPSLDSSRKEGYAVIGSELSSATEQAPVMLRLTGALTAGDRPAGIVLPGQAVRVTTGAPLPSGADAVLADEFARIEDGRLVCLAPAEPGRNVLPRGADVEPGDVLCRTGDILTPGLVGLLASGGIAGLEVHSLPRVAVLATGSEVHKPGEALGPGGLYASNMISLQAWLRVLGMSGPARLAGDDLAAIREACAELLENADALVTSGGTGHGERDLLERALADIGVKTVFSGVRLGPGKGAVFGLLERKPVFCLPGGPPACLVAFLKLALPAFKRLAGCKETGLPLVWARLVRDAKGQTGWTNVIQGEISLGQDTEPVFDQLRGIGRLESIARANALLVLGEDVTHVRAGSPVMAELINLWPLGPGS